jgi:hypothetical protein
MTHKTKPKRWKTPTTDATNIHILSIDGLSVESRDRGRKIPTPRTLHYHRRRAGNVRTTTVSPPNQSKVLDPGSRDNRADTNATAYAIEGDEGEVGKVKPDHEV